MTDKKLDLSHMKVFGCKAFAHIPKANRKKWDDKAVELMFVGYSFTSKGKVSLIDPSTFKIVESRNVIFIENKMMMSEHCTKSKYLLIKKILL